MPGTGDTCWCTESGCGHFFQDRYDHSIPENPVIQLLENMFFSALTARTASTMNGVAGAYLLNWL